ncbi:hypothetical protein D3Z58_24395 [Clostridiaceae bacterium]|nr:hypothetical protein [Clostridiaceae bacterium]
MKAAEELGISKNTMYGWIWAAIIDSPAACPNESKGGHRLINCHFIIISTPLSPYMPLQRATLCFAGQQYGKDTEPIIP